MDDTLFSEIKERLMICYARSGWKPKENFVDKIVFFHQDHREHVFIKETELPIFTSCKLNQFLCIKYLTNETISFSVYFIFNNVIYAFETSLENEELSEDFRYVDEFGIHHNISKNDDMREEFNVEIKEIKKFNRYMFEKMPKYRLLFLTGEY